MLRLALFLGTNLAVLAMLSFSFKVLGLEGLLAANGVDLNLQALLIFSGIIGISGSLISLLLAKSIAKASMGVRVITTPRTRAERWLLETVQAQADAAGIGHPEVGIFDHPSPNAFATGWNRNDALVAVRNGLISALSPNEVEAVLAHEVSHSANGDMVTLA